MSGNQSVNLDNSIVFATLAAMQAAPYSTSAAYIPPGSLCIALDTPGGAYMWDPTASSTVSANDVYPNVSPGVFFYATVPVLYLNDAGQLTTFNGVPVSSAFAIQYAGQNSYGGGSATHAITVTGVLATDLVFANIQTSTNAVTVEKVTPTTNTITVLMSGDPGASTLINYQVLRQL